ncbi:two-component regulator propeller domain-containing protein, partial [Reichenbachiella sp.]
NSISHNDIRPIFEDEDYLWVGTDGGGLNRIDRKRNEIKVYRHNSSNINSLSNDYVYDIVKDDNGILWIGTDGGGLNAYDPDADRFVCYKHNPQNPNTLSNDHVRLIKIDRSGKLWIGTNGGGLDVYDPITGHFTNYKHHPNDPNSLGNNRIYAMYIDESETVWLGTYGGGLSRFDQQTQKFTNYGHTPGDKTSLSNDFVLAVYEDAHGTIWVGTSVGLCKMNKEKGTFITYTKQEGLSDEVIYDIITDNYGKVWISSNGGLTRFDPNQMDFKNYDAKDGLQSNEFNTGTAYKSKSGELFFGGINGFNAFFPEHMWDDPHVPKIVITDFTIFNKSVPIGKMEDGRTLLKQSITKTKEIQLSYTDKVFAFEYAALHYASPEKNQYAYMIEGLEDDWNYVGSRRFVSYTSLPPGKYVFKVKGSNNDGLWNEEGTSIRLTILPAWWSTIWARILFVLSIAGIATMLYRLRMRKLSKQKKELEQLVAQRTKELKIKNERIVQQAEELHAYNANLNQLNENLEQTVSDRTKELTEKNRKLEEYAFMNAHNLRLPITNIQGLIQLFDIDRSYEETKEMLKLVKGQSDQIDKVLIDIQSKLDDDHSQSLEI